MNSRERFRETMSYGMPDRVPYFEEGMRDEVLKAWHAQGLPLDADFSKMFSTDLREEIELDVDPHPGFVKWPTTRSGLKALHRRLDPADPSRLPEKWSEQVRAWKGLEHVLMLRVHHGFFLTMGVEGWRRFYEVMRLTSDDPLYVQEVMQIQGEFAARLVERVLAEVQVDALVFSEPIGGNHGPLISPRMYEEYCLASYQPLLDTAHRHGVETIILRTYANARALVPVLVKHGFNCLWACECQQEAMDYRSIRREFGRDLRLIGGIDLDVLRSDPEAIRREVEEKVPPLVAEGGYAPLADGRIREDIPFENYVYYRKLLEKITQR